MSKRAHLASSSSSDEAQYQRKRFKDEGGDSSTSTSQGSTDGEQEKAITYLNEKGEYSGIASRMMAKMGYKAGTGLGAKEQGRVEPVEASKQRGRRGLGLVIAAMEKKVVTEWKDSAAPNIVETVKWMPRCLEPLPEYSDLCDWAIEGNRKLIIEDETLFCEEDLLKMMLECKNVFDDLEGFELRHARTRSNPYETIRGAMFLNRAAMKMANMDHAFNFLFTSPEDLSPDETFYFADVCAGPGGFSEYVLWRKKWHAKGFGFTLKGKNDFKLTDFFAADPELFECHYGVNGANGDGDVMNSDNLVEFQSFVLENTNGKGVHFMMADGGFSVEGQENIQEILTKQLLLCQFACALSVLRVKGTFLCKTFDLFTPFSAGLVYLLRRAFEDVTIFKPITSRPANSERYVVCKGYRDPDRLIGDYLLSVNQTMNELKGTERDITNVVPLDVLMEDTEFCDYLKESNEEIATKQCKALAKLHAFAKNRDLKEMRQAQIRKDCLQLWQIPDKVRAAPQKTNARECFLKYTEGMHNPLEVLRNQKMLTQQTLSALQRVYDYRCYICSGRKSILLSLGGTRLYEWNGNRWIQNNEINCLIPRNTILEVELVPEFKGEGKSQRRSMGVHVIDAMVLGGEVIRNKHYTERLTDIKLFVTAIQKPTMPHLNTVRCKTIYRCENIQEVFKNLSMKRVKGAGVEPRLCCDLENTENCFIPSGLCFVKITKDPWAMAFSRSRNRKYFYNTVTKVSSFDCPPDFCATYEMCASSRLYWSWEAGVKVHSDQQHRRPDLLSADDVLNFLREHK